MRERRKEREREGNAMGDWVGTELRQEIKVFIIIKKLRKYRQPICVVFKFGSVKLN